MAFACRVLADSISPSGHRLTSFEGTFPRIILAEVNTHCMLSRNSASSRATPVKRRISDVSADPFVPESFGRNQKGMQPGASLEGHEALRARDAWMAACSEMIKQARELDELGVHKQYANRLLEPFGWHTAVITATDVDNLFNLRVNPMAQGEFQTFARLMKEAREASTPHPINFGEWHLPYVEPSEAFDLEVQQIEPWKVSVARCARISYLTQNGVRDPKEDVALYERLVEPGHMSPLEHVARPMTNLELAITKSYDIAIRFEDEVSPVLRWRWDYTSPPEKGQPLVLNGRECEIAFVRGPLHYAGKLNGWISRRQFVLGEHDILGHRASQ